MSAAVKLFERNNELVVGAHRQRFLEFKNGSVRLSYRRIDAPSRSRISIDCMGNGPARLIEIC